MKRLTITLITFCISGIAFSQAETKSTDATGKIKLAHGQIITVENTTDMEASLSMGGEMTSNSSTSNSLVVKNSNDINYTITNTLTKLKMIMSMMGQVTNYDSENKNGNNTEIAAVLDNSINKPIDVVLEKNTGLAVGEGKKAKKTSAELSSTASDLMKMFSDNSSDDAVVASAFQLIPAGKKTGDSWSDTTLAKGVKIFRKFTLSSITANEAVIALNAVSTAQNKLDFMEMEFDIKTETKTKGEIISDINTGLVKKRTTNAEISGSFQMMGQDMPINAKTNSVSVYK